MKSLAEIQLLLGRSMDCSKQLDNALASGALGVADKANVGARLDEVYRRSKELEHTLSLLAEQYQAETISVKQQIWERKLLDLTLRNNLLNMRVGRSVVGVDLCEQVSDLALLEQELDMGREFILDRKELKNIYRTARTNMEEMGANTLFLTLGTLKWCEQQGGKMHCAPILLVPVVMVPVRGGGYAIRKRDEDVELNITLTEFLRHNYGITVEGCSPLPQNASGVDVSLVMHLLAEAVKEHTDWSVDDETMVGIFSFTKLVLWNDIHRHAPAMLSSPIVRSLTNGRLVLDDSDKVLADAEEMDVAVRPEKMAVPLDADSSQLEAVADAEAGRSFILYGPPGTGKSQTITNLIANALYHGKRVLFVAQKKAALDVVKNRLAKIGLAPYCLELHSNKMDKRHFLQQMETALGELAKKENADYAKTATVLYDHRMQIKGYVDAIHTKHASGCSLSDCIDRYLSVDAKPFILPKDFCKGKTAETVEILCKRIKALDASTGILNGVAPMEHPLRGLWPKAQPQSKALYVSMLDKGDALERQLKELPKALDAIRKMVERNRKFDFMHKTTRQYVEGDYKVRRLLQLADIDSLLLDDIDALEDTVKRWNGHIDKLPQWKQYCAMLDELKTAGLSCAVEQYMAGCSTDEICRSFTVAFYSQLALDIIAQDKVLSSFRGVLFEQVIDRYRELAKEFRRLTCEELVARIAAANPVYSRDVAISSELTLLRRRIGSKGRGVSIRSVIGQMPNLLPKLCPVMLMSPLSVAQYLDVEGPKFDVVVFDEASQIPTCEAVGAIARGLSVVVVGDPKQMPPTNFFSTNVTEYDTDEDDMESILDDCISLSMPARYLSWHYRSKHESLISFSNHNFYDGRLITFPSCDDMVSHVSLQHVDGCYDFGNTRTNKAEAKAVADEVVRRMQAEPDRSIGVVAFSRQQSDLIEDLINESFAAHPVLEARNAASEEPLFIKNLENVQGDERDVILFSVGYGPDKDGHVSMNFGPLNQNGGERRLNVAVSRARYEMKVFTSMHYDQIDERRTQAEGVMGLKRFLRYAKLGQTESQLTGESEVRCNRMAALIAEKLRDKGYEVKTGIGTSSFCVDVGVVNPQNPAQYVLGIVCDGSDYYKLKTVCDREIVQPAMLKMLGWKLLRVWSVDWLTNPDLVMKNIIAAIKG